ncbi:PEPxxWA-CTERM sorting domain-containing protein [Phenylobacterium sp.]|uniref:PEPxxWA-CTERM sorting domain-containing protein n=1 Tax=Phenylobacterium sp. TaxID=1871053 RepID=UPI002CA6B220|nr:PEPxxWA-CTERM sorting domain-containing protein [Phenylobacterium sp.]HLZ73849.1 PEPxxWA-CTERM sorting domain-containing protein [Phenylobacterium sp.]
MSKRSISQFAGAALAVTLGGGLATSATAATELPLGAAANFTVLYTGTGGHNLSISNDIITGAIGVGGTGKVQFSGPGTIGGALDFSAANSGQYHNTNASNVGPTSVNYSDAAVATALTDIGALSTALTGGNNIAFTNAGETINESAGKAETVDGVSVRVFNVTSYSANDNSVLDIVGDGSGAPVVFDFSFNSNVNLGGTVKFTGTGLTNGDQVLWNFKSSGKQVSLNNNKQTFIGAIVAMADTIQMDSVNLQGRVYGGGSGDLHIVSGANVFYPEYGAGGGVPEPASWALMILGFGSVGQRLRSRRSAPATT